MRLRLPLAAGIVVAAMLVISPGPPRPDRADPAEVLDDALSAALNAHYSAVQDWQYALHGRNARVRLRVDCPPDSTNPTELVAMARLVKNNYTPLIEGEDTIAGRETWVLRLKPHSKYRPWRHLWIDKKTHVVLAMREWDNTNRVKKTMRTISISYPPLGSRSRSSACAPAARSLSAPDPTSGVATRLPGGYHLVGVKHHHQTQTTQFVYSDGLQSISVLRGFPNSRGREQKQGQHVSDWGQGLVMSTDGAGEPVTVVGDLPMSEIQRIARSTR